MPVPHHYNYLFLYRKFHHVLLQNHSCISSDRLNFSHPAVFQSQLHQNSHNIWHWAFPRSCSTEPGAQDLPSSRITTAGLPTIEQTPSTGAEFLFPPQTPTSVFKLITAVSGGQWVFDSPEPLLVPVFHRNERSGEWLQPWEDPKSLLMAPAPWWCMYQVSLESANMLPISFPASLPRAAGFITFFSYCAEGVCSCESRSDLTCRPAWASQH